MADEAETTENEAADGQNVSEASFPDLGGVGGDVASGEANLDMVRDIPVRLTVELGRAEMLIEEILQLTSGKVIELEKLAGEPLDIMVNGRLLARGEVVVVDENFGVRITSILDPRSRVQAMSGDREGPIVEQSD